MTRLLDLIAVHAWFLSRLFLGFGIMLAAYYWLLLSTSMGAPVDMRWYWEANPGNLYPHPELLQQNGYNYSPAFELVVGWGRLLPFDAFVAVWRALLVVVLVWLAGPLTVFVLFLFPVASEINAGNIQFLMAAAIVLGFRGGWWPATWAFILLSKVSPGVGLLWFLARRQWRALAIALGVTAAIAALSFVVWPERWFGWAALLANGRVPPPVAPFYLSFGPRFAVAVLITIAAAWRGWQWPVIVAATLALPAFYTISPALLVGVLPFARAAFGRWAAKRKATITAHAETLRRQGNPSTDGIVSV